MKTNHCHQGDADAHQHQHHGHHHDGHHHSHHHGHHHHQIEGNILFAFIINLIFSIVEFVGGILTGSVAILSDALHDLGDSLSLALAWYLQRLSKKGRDATFTYGYKRFSLLSALFISLILLSGSIVVLYTAIGRILTPTEPNATGMLWLAIFGLLVNALAVWRMGGGHSLSERSIRLHLMEDVLGWAAVLLVSIVMHFVDLPILDPLLSIGITFWILYNVYFNLRDSFRILLQGIPEGISQERLESRILELKDVVNVHDTHIWTLDGETHIASIHIVHRNDLVGSDALCQLKQSIRAIALEEHIEHLTIEFDLEGISCGMEQCATS